MSGTFHELYQEVGCLDPDCYQVYTTDSYPSWQEEDGSYILFLFGWDDRLLVYSRRGFSTTESPGSTCCLTSTGNRYDSPLMPSCGSSPPTPGCEGCNAEPGVN